MVEVPPKALLAYTEAATVDFLRRLLPSLTGQWQVTSWYRDEALNRSLGSSRHSQHRIGLAVDLVGDRWSLSNIADRVRARGLVPVQEGDHLHIQMFPAGFLVEAGYEWLFRIA